MNWTSADDEPVIDPDKAPLQVGKYKGQTPEEICLDDPGYLVWAYENIGHHICSKEMYLACEELAESEKQSKRKGRNPRHRERDEDDYLY